MSSEASQSLRDQKSTSSTSWTEVEWVHALKDYSVYQNFKTAEYPNVEWEQYCHDQNH